MSKPKPGLGKGIVRTLAVAQHPSTGTILTLAPVVGQHAYHSSSSGGGGGAGGPSKPSASGWPSASPTQAPSAYVSLLPTWDQISNEIVLSYSNQSRLRTSLKPSHVAVAGPGPSSSTRGIHSRRYSSVSISPSAFLTSPPPPSSFFFDRSISFSTPTPSQSSLDALLASLEIASGSHLNGWNGHRPNTSTFDSPPFSPPPPGPGASAKSSPQQPLKALRPSESHTVLSAPLPQSDASNSNSSISLSSHPLLALHESPANFYPSSSEQPDATATVPYSSSLIFHLGASGLPKERIPPSRLRKERPPTPPRQRSFPLPEVEAPSSLTSVAVGEDAYFARPDGMCIADGVGAWSRSGKGTADAGRWSRLLTHFCEEEVGDWWAGKEVYLVQPPRQSADTASTSAGNASSSAKGKGKAADGKRGWAKELWEDRQLHTASAVKEKRERRPLDPVEIMQRGFEKCLACALTEGVHGSSTCLLALLHNSTLHIANLGDCCLLLIRRGEVVFRTSDMQHAFNFPLQVGTHSRDEPMKDAMRYDVGVKKGDVVVLGSDGLMDNLFDEDILEIVSQFTSPKSSSSHSPTGAGAGAQSSFPPFNPQHISDALCRQARSVSELVTATTPFMARAIEEGIDFVGGKKDDISVVVGVIGDRENVPSGGPDGGGRGLRLHL